MWFRLFNCSLCRNIKPTNKFNGKWVHSRWNQVSYFNKFLSVCAWKIVKKYEKLLLRLIAMEDKKSIVPLAVNIRKIFHMIIILWKSHSQLITSHRHSLIEIVWPLQLKSHCYCFCLHWEFYNTTIDGTHKDQKNLSHLLRKYDCFI